MKNETQTTRTGDEKMYAVFHADSIQVAGDFARPSEALRWIADHKRSPYYRVLRLSVGPDREPELTEEQLQEQDVDRAVDRMLGK